MNFVFYFPDVKYPKVASWDAFFQGCVSRVLLTLVGSPPNSSPVNKHDPNTSVDTVPVSDKQGTRPQLPNPLTNGKHSSAGHDSSTEIPTLPI